MECLSVTFNLRCLGFVFHVNIWCIYIIKHIEMMLSLLISSKVLYSELIYVGICAFACAEASL